MGSVESILRGLLGLSALLGIAFLLSRKRKAINWRTVAFGVGLQFFFAVCVLKIPPFRAAFEFIAGIFVAILGAAAEGSRMLFGKLVDIPNTDWGFIFAVQALPTIVYFSALSALLYYLGILQKIVYAFAWVMNRSLKISGSESLNAAANIFMGQTEAPLVIKPFLNSMTRSEIMCVMTGGMATIAGSVLAAYVGFLGGGDPVQAQFYATHLLSASIMSAPAAVVAAKMLYPETEHVNTEMKVSKENIGSNMLDAVANGTTDGLKLAINVAGMLIVFTAIMALLNFILFTIGGWTGMNASIEAMSGGAYKGFDLKFVFGYVFAPLAWLLGTPTADIIKIGQLLGEKTILNEFIAYTTMEKMQTAGLLVSEKSKVIAIYALCGFSNFASVGIQIGGIGALAPGQRKTLTELGIMALIGGSIACFLTACIAGMFY